MTVTIGFEKLRFIGESRSGLRCSGLSGRVTIRLRSSGLSVTVTIGFEKLRFIGESHDQVRDAQVYRGESRSGSRRSGLSGRVTIRFRDAQVYRESHDQVRDAQVYREESQSGFEMLRFIGESHDQV